VPIAFLGLPSLHSVIEGIANGFFGALANALVPGFLKHGTVATIQHLVALPDPGTWGHVHQLQGDTTYLAAMLMPVTLAAGTLRYWLVGLTGQAHPVTAVTRCTWVTAVLVVYPWIVQQTVAATNTITHAILGFPTVGDGLQRIIGVLFGGALLAGAGGVFGAFLVIIGVLFAAGLFAAQVMLTVALALLIVAGPPLIALSAIPELSHLARAWAHALLATTLVPLGWTVLFATAGALCLDATSFTGGATGLPGHVAAAFAGLITFILAVKLPWMLFGELRRLLTNGSLAGHPRTTSAPRQAPGVERVKAAHARLRSAAFDGVPSLGRNVGRAAGAMGAPAGGPLGAAGRGATKALRRSGIAPAAAVATSSAKGVAAATQRGKNGEQQVGLRRRFKQAGTIVREAPKDARASMTHGDHRTSNRRSADNDDRRPGPHQAKVAPGGRVEARVRPSTPTTTPPPVERRGPAPSAQARSSTLAVAPRKTAPRPSRDPTPGPPRNPPSPTARTSTTARPSQTTRRTVATYPKQTDHHPRTPPAPETNKKPPSETNSPASTRDENPARRHARTQPKPPR
jgi:hypothetical protein